MEDIESIKQIILDNHPQFQHAAQRLNTDGWDNLALILDERVVFRIPRNEISRRQLLVELHYLPQIAAVSPLPVPFYTYFSKDPGIYAGYDLILGQPLEKYVFDSCTKMQQREMAKSLGLFLSTLHSMDVNQTIPSSPPVRQQNRQSWLDLQAEVFSKAAYVLQPIHMQKIEKMFSYILAEVDFDAIPKTLIHGDLSSDHIMYDASCNEISGIIDFGDLMIGDPAYDFAGIFLEYGREILDKVLDNYEPALDDHFLERVERFYIPKVPLHSLLFGIEQGNEGLVSFVLRETEDS